MVAPENLEYDPLRLLRAYRFVATHGFNLLPRTPRPRCAATCRIFPGWPESASIRNCSSCWPLPRAGEVLKDMDRAGLLTQVFPELADARDVEQNGFHHLDVFNHLLETMVQLENVLAAPAQYFGELAGESAGYAARPAKAVLLKLAALFHDVGKPQVRERRSQPERYTFYYHEKVGLEILPKPPGGCA